MPRAKQAVVSAAIEDDVALTPEEEASLKAQETDETPIELPKPEDEAAEKVEAKAEKKHEETVSYERFEEINQRAKQLEAEAKQNQEYRERWSRLEERQKMAQEAAAQQRAQEEAARQAQEMPDPNLDPAGYRAWAAEKLARETRAELDAFRAAVLQQNEQNVQSQANQEMNNWLAFQVPQARSTVPDYDLRVDYAREQRAKWWGREFNLPNGQRVALFPPEVAKDITDKEEMVLLNRCKMMGIPIHMAVSALSDQWGYKSARTPGLPMSANTAADMAGVAPYPNGKTPPSANRRLEQIEKGQAVTGLGQRPSGDAANTGQWQTMDNDEFKLHVYNMGEDAYLEAIQDKKFLRRVEEMQLEG